MIVYCLHANLHCTYPKPMQSVSITIEDESSIDYLHISNIDSYRSYVPLRWVKGSFPFKVQHFVNFLLAIKFSTDFVFKVQILVSFTFEKIILKFVVLSIVLAITGYHIA